MSGAAAENIAPAPADLIAGEAIALEGDSIRSHNPARPAETVWCASSRVQHVDRAVAAARAALPAWALTPREKRFEALRVFQAIAKERAETLARLISLETGKALWDARAEAGLIAGKVDITLEEGANTGQSRVTGFELELGPTKRGVCFFRPHGVMAVLGPFNFPAHLPNGHIVPALATGNTVVFKPSDKTPAVGQFLGEMLVEALREAGAPSGVVNVVQGGADVASRLATHDDIDGLLFTGSWPVGRRILEANLDRPGRIVALEMGGNNAAIVLNDADLRQAAIECARCAFISTGQRCTCTRRIVVQRGVADRFIAGLVESARRLSVGDPFAEPPVFMGPIVREESRRGAIRFAAEAQRGGAELLLEPRAVDDVPGCAGGHFLTPGVLRVDGFSRSEEGPDRDAGCDVEVFGPLVRVCVVDTLDEAIEQANATRFGLAASIFTRSKTHIHRFLTEVRAGCLNVNTGTAGASSKLPFGGLGLSGNHRPAGAFSLDYCACPVASMVEEGDAAAISPGMTFDDSWVG